MYSAILSSLEEYPDIDVRVGTADSETSLGSQACR